MPPMPSSALAELRTEAARREAAGDLPGALDSLSALLAHIPDDAAALLGLARISRRLGAPADGLAVLAALGGGTADQMMEAGHCHAALDAPERAEAAYGQAAALAPHWPEPWLALARLRERRRDAAGARALFDRLLEHHPDDPDILLRASFFLRRQGDYAAAEAVCRRLVAAHPRQPLAWNSLGISLYVQERLAEADTSLTAALGLDPGCAAARFSRGFLRLAQGRWRDGWEGFRWRHRLPDAPPPPAGWPEWNPAAPPPAGSQILLWNDQGLGDALQFLRYVPLLAQRGYRPLLRLPPSLLRLGLAGGARLDGLPELSSTGDPPPLPRGATAAHLALCDLPLALAAPGTEPAPWWPGPYLRPPPRTAAAPLAAPGRRGIGLVWAGSAAHDNNARRSLTLELLAPLRDLPDIDWFSLQLGPAAAEIPASPWAGRLTDLAPRIGDFADTAALMERLDLIITVDTAAAHLAGGLGRPAWVPLPRRGDWRWGLAGTGSSWYPSLRLFRQPEPGDWPAVVADMAAALQRREAEKPPGCDNGMGTGE